MRKIVLFAILAGCVLAGCAHYRFGNPVPESRRKLAVPVFGSSVTQPEAEAVVTQALCREIIRDGSFTLANAEDAALTLKGTVTAYTLKPLGDLENTSGIPVKYRTLLTAKVMIVETATGAVVVPTFSLTAETTALARTDLATAKGAALHRAAQSLARAILLEAITRCSE